MINNPMKDRRAALDLAIYALDRYRTWVRKTYHPHAMNIEEERIDNINKAIQILTEMKEQGPLI